MEPEFWAALTRIAAMRSQRLSGLVAAADGARDTSQPLASALRVLALQTLDPSTTAEPAADAAAVTAERNRTEQPVSDSETESDSESENGPISDSH